MTDASPSPDPGVVPLRAAYLSTTRLPVRYALMLWAALGLLSWVLVALPFLLG